MFNTCKQNQAVLLMVTLNPFCRQFPLLVRLRLQQRSFKDILMALMSDTFFRKTEAVVRRCFVKKVFLEILQSS